MTREKITTQLSVKNSNSHKVDFENMVNTQKLKMYNALSDVVLPNTEKQLFKGQVVYVINGYRRIVGPFEILGFSMPDDYGRCVYLDWDCYWFAKAPKDIIMGKIDDQVIELSVQVLKESFRSSKSIFCSMVLRLMDTEEYGCNYCRSLDLVLTLFPEVDRKLLEYELDKYL